MQNSALTRAFGRRVRAIRTLRSLSQEELAARAEVHRTFIGRVERGETNITLANIQKLARGLRVRMTELVSSIDGGSR